METKKCSKCKEEKPLTETYFAIKSNGKWRSECRLCGNKMTRDYKARNKEHIKDYNKTYKKEHKEEISEYNSAYFAEHKDEIYARRNAYIKANPSFAVRLLISSRIGSNIKQIHKLEGSNTYFDVLGCTGEFFLKWIEYLDTDLLFDWDEKENWHLDHVNPCSNFNLTERNQLEECFHWSNYQPLLKEDNLSKSDTVDLELIKNHKQKAINFIEEYASQFFKDDEYVIL